jgi:AcrR family transcriptional regulator
MASTKKRKYNSDSRRARTSELGRRILTAAKKLFAMHGIDKVTIDELAGEAGVSSPTIYSLYESKAGLLRALIKGTFFGDNYAAVSEKTKTTDDPIELLRITASISRVIFDTEKAEIGLIRGASAFSSDLRKIEAEFEQIRYVLQEKRANLLVQEFPTARELGIAKVRDIMWMYTGRDIYRMFVLERGWSADAYEEWLARTLIQVLTMEPLKSRDNRAEPSTSIDRKRAKHLRAPKRTSQG